MLSLDRFPPDHTSSMKVLASIPTARRLDGSIGIPPVPLELPTTLTPETSKPPVIDTTIPAVSDPRKTIREAVRLVDVYPQTVSAVVVDFVASQN